MVEIASRPIIEHQLMWLAENGVRDVVISVGHQAEVLKEHVATAHVSGYRRTTPLNRNR
jgi:NDP-sugar pyrophosphorylase family protein